MKIKGYFYLNKYVKMFRLSLFLCLITSVFFAQEDNKITGKVKSVSEKIIYLKPLPKTENCLDCDPFSSYQFGTYIIIDPKVYDSFFKNNWINSTFSTYKNSEKKFNTKGLKTSEVWFEPNKSIFYKYDYKYDDNDSITQIKKSGKNDEIFSIRNFFFSNKTLQTAANFTSDNSYSYRSYEYDSKNNLTQIKYYDENGYSHTNIYSYNSNNKLLEVNKHSPFKMEIDENNVKIMIKDSIGETKVFKKQFYDIKNRLIETHTFNYDGQEKSKIEKTVFTYNKNDKIIEIRLVINDFQFFKIYEYNNEGEHSKIFVNHPNPNDNLEYQYIYSDKIIIKSIIKREKILNTLTFNYKFDKKGNWIQQTKSVDGKPLYIWKRKIEYYKE